MSSAACRHRDDCRLCGSRNLVCVLELAPTPPANAFVPETKLNERQESYPLDIWFCRDCKHIQLLDIVDPTVLFGDYPSAIRQGVPDTADLELGSAVVRTLSKAQDSLEATT